MRKIDDFMSLNPPLAMLESEGFAIGEDVVVLIDGKERTERVWSIVNSCPVRYCSGDIFTGIWFDKNGRINGQGEIVVKHKKGFNYYNDIVLKRRTSDTLLELGVGNNGIR